MEIFKNLVSKLKKVFKTPIFEPFVYVLIKNKYNLYDIKFCKESVAQAHKLYIIGRDDDEAVDNYIRLMLDKRDSAKSENERQYYINCIRWYALHYHDINLDENLKIN